MAKPTVLSLSQRVDMFEATVMKFVEKADSAAKSTDQVLASHELRLSALEDRLKDLEVKAAQVKPVQSSSPKGKTYAPAYSSSPEVPVNSYRKPYSHWSPAYANMNSAKANLSTFQALHPGKVVNLARCKAGFCWAI